MPNSPTTLTAFAIASIFLLFTGICMATGIYQVHPGEAAAIQTFGTARPEPMTTEGLHWHWPSPIGKTTILQVQKSRTVELGYQTLPDETIDSLTLENWQRDFQAATMITGDIALLETQLVAHYYISDLNKYLFAADDPGVIFEYVKDTRIRTHKASPPGRPDGQTIKDALEIAIRRSIGQRTIDEALVFERETIELETMQHAQDILDRYRTGISITSVQLQEVKPPDEVQSAFDDVLKAREEKDTRINQALAFESKTLPEARGQAEKIRKEAEAYRAQRINEATGEASRFLDIHREYSASPDIIAKRMYLETMDHVLPRTNQIIVTGKQPGSLIITTDPATRTIVPITQPTE